MHQQIAENCPAGRAPGFPAADESAAHPLEGLVAAAFGISATLRNPNRGPALVALARQVAIYLAHTRLHMTYTDAGALFARDRTTAAHACRLVEERREDPRLDMVVDCLERAIDQLAVRPAVTGQAGG